MAIAILGTGNIGSAVARNLAAGVSLAEAKAAVNST
jgi:predicted dinucleotide-binding enzyme